MAFLNTFVYVRECKAALQRNRRIRMDGYRWKRWKQRWQRLHRQGYIPTKW